MDYAKKNSKENWYNINAWRYYSEYNAHMYAWYLTGWAFEKNIPLISNIAKMASDADVDLDYNKKWYYKIAYGIIGFLYI